MLYGFHANSQLDCHTPMDRSRARDIMRAGYMGNAGKDTNNSASVVSIPTKRPSYFDKDPNGLGPYFLYSFHQLQRKTR